jgi:hypothetical protein
MATRKTTDAVPAADDPATDPTPDAVDSAPAVEDTSDDPAPEADEPAADPIEAEYGDAGPGLFVALEDFTAMVGAQLCTFKKGASIDPLAGAELASGGAPVEPA